MGGYVRPKSTLPLLAVRQTMQHIAVSNRCDDIQLSAPDFHTQMWHSDSLHSHTNSRQQQPGGGGSIVCTSWYTRLAHSVETLPEPLPLL